MIGCSNPRDIECYAMLLTLEQERQTQVSYEQWLPGLLP